MWRKAASKLPGSVFLALLISIAWTGSPDVGAASPVTFSGTVSYEGSSSGDTLYVALLDTMGVEDVTLLALEAIPVGAPPFAQSYSFDFDNADVSPELLVAAFLDVDGGGIDNINGVDVFGWYDGHAIPRGISPAGSRLDLDFALPRAEIHGTVMLAPGQTEARIDVSTDTMCLMEGFRPRHFAFSSGAYSIIGLYSGTYCVSAYGSDMSGPRHVCYGDPTCTSPSLIPLTEAEVRNGVDLDFSPLAIENRSWGNMKLLFR